MAISQFYNGGIMFETLIDLEYPKYELIKNITVDAKKNDGERI